MYVNFIVIKFSSMWGKISILLKEYQETYNKLDESADEKDIDKVFEKAEKILEIVKELEKRSWDGDEKASKEIEEWNKLVIEMNIEF